MAAERAETDCAVWAIDGPWALEVAAKLLHKGGKANRRTAKAIKRMESGNRFNEGEDQDASPLFLQKPFVTASWPINAFYLNERLRIQGGVFMVTGDVRRPFMDNLQSLDSDAKDHVVQITIPIDQAKQAVKALYAMNISRTTLFPGLDGFAQSLNIWNPAFDPRRTWKRAIKKHGPVALP